MTQPAHPLDAPHPLHAFKAARQREVEAADAPRRAELAALLKELHGDLLAHAGHEVTKHLKVELHQHQHRTLLIHAPGHIPVLMQHEEGQLKFGVRRGRSMTWFGHLGDALIHGQPFEQRDNDPIDGESFTTFRHPLVPPTVPPTD